MVMSWLLFQQAYERGLSLTLAGMKRKYFRYSTTQPPSHPFVFFNNPLPLQNTNWEVYELRPLNPFIQVSPLGCKALHGRLRYLLSHYTTPPLASPTFTAIEDFLVRAVYTLPSPPAISSSLQTGIIPNQDLKSIYESQSSESIGWFVPSQQRQLAVPRWIPSCATELFFEGDRSGIIPPDTDEMGLVANILDSLARLPRLVRAAVIQGIVVVGGGAAIPGLRTRLRNELERAWDVKSGKVRSTTPETEPPGLEEGQEGAVLSMADLAPVKSHTLKFITVNPLEATFLGGSMLGDIKVKGFTEVSRDEFNSNHGQGVSDWTFIGGVGDDGVDESIRRSHRG
jgi:hypothetical protein